jgi:tetratricopeptide (TPR) repeat protein
MAARNGRGAQSKIEPAVPWWIALAVAVGLFALTLWAWAPRPAPEPHVERGNAHYTQRHYREALGEYESAPGAGPRNAGVQLDRGLSRYRLATPASDGGVLSVLPPDASAPDGLARAQDELRTAARGGTTNATEEVDTDLRGRAAYDLGNTFFAQRAWNDAIEAYKESLRIRPGDRDAAWNLELARRAREDENNKPDAGPEAGQDAATPDSGDGGRPDGGTRSDGGQPGADGGPQGQDGGGAPADAGGHHGDAGPEPERDAGTTGRDASAPRSMAPLDDLDRSSRSLQSELARRRGPPLRGPDDDR